jgi:hypothetical protein
MLRPYKLSPTLGGRIIEGTPISDKLVSIELDGKLVQLPVELLTLVVPPEPFGKVMISFSYTIKERDTTHSVWERLQTENVTKPFKRIDSQTQQRTWSELIDLMYTDGLMLTMYRPSQALYTSDFPERDVQQGTCAHCSRYPVQIRNDGMVKNHKSILTTEPRSSRYQYCIGSNKPPKEAK